MNIPILFIDLETLATCPEASVLQMAWVAGVIDPDIDGYLELGAQSYHFTQRSNIQAKRAVARTTVDWWTKDPERAEMFEKMKSMGTRDVRTLPELLSTDIKHLQDNYNFKNFQLWVNGAAFDIPILKSFYYHKASSEYRHVPWHYSQERDFRTLKNQNRNLFDRARAEFLASGEDNDHEHNALVDAYRDLYVLAEFYNAGYVVY